jgi:TolB-like protein/tetratricopeptide (TPR) repeat protein
VSAKQSLWSEIKRRNVFRVGLFYVVTAWLVIEVAETVLPLFDVPDGVLRGLVVLLVIGLVPALGLSWIYELTPEGIKRDAGPSAADAQSSDTGRKLNWATLAVAVIAIGFMAMDRMRPAPPVVAPTATPASTAAHAPSAAPGMPDGADRTDSPETADTPDTVDAASIAVLPFADLSPTGDQAYFSDGIAEEILNALTRVEGLAVASRTSAFQFKGREIGIPEIARALSVRHVLEGSVRKAGDALRITAQLIDASNDRHLWSDTFDRSLTAENVFQIQDEIAAAITRALGVAMKLDGEQLVSSAGATDDIDAYALYLEARTLYHQRNDLVRADELLEKALEQDPAFARAWELRAPIPSLAIEYGDSNEPLEAAEARSRQYAARALELNPGSSLALATMGKILMEKGASLRGLADWAMVLDYFEQAIEADPTNASAFLWRGNALDVLGFIEESLAAYEQCVVLEPLYLPCVNNRPFSLVTLGRFDEALAVYRQDLGRGLSLYGFGLIPLWVEMKSDILFMEAANHPEALKGFPRQAELYAAHLDPSGDYAELVADAIKHRPPLQTFVGQSITEWLLVPLGYTEINGLWSPIWSDSFRRFRQTETFKRIIRDAGVQAYWREHRFPPLCRPVGADEFACD